MCATGSNPAPTPPTPSTKSNREPAGCRSSPNGTRTPLIAISRSHNTPETFAHVEALRRRYPDAQVIEQGSSYKFCLLAEGRVDYYVRTTHTYEWDTAAGELILAEAGGRLEALADGAAFRYNKRDLQNPWFVCRAHNCAIV